MKKRWKAVQLTSAAALLLLLPVLVASQNETTEDAAVVKESNCFSRVPDYEWPSDRVLEYNSSTATLTFSPMSAGDKLLECLREGRRHRLRLLREEVEEVADRTFAFPEVVVTFPYVLLPGSYSVQFDCEDCEAVTSNPVAVLDEEDCAGVEAVVDVAVVERTGAPGVAAWLVSLFSSSAMSEPASFHVDFSPGCDTVLADVPYLAARVSLYQAQGTVSTDVVVTPFFAIPVSLSNASFNSILKSNSA
jgi:hypothetical protein